MFTLFTRTHRLSLVVVGCSPFQSPNNHRFHSLILQLLSLASLSHVHGCLAGPQAEPRKAKVEQQVAGVRNVEAITGPHINGQWQYKPF